MIHTRTISTELRVTRWVRVEWDGAVVAYRIWVQTDGRRWWQCHEYEKAGGNGERYFEGWIDAIRGWPRDAADPEAGADIPPG